MNYLDLAYVMSLVQKFHVVYNMPNVRFDVEYAPDGMNHIKIGWGSVSLSPYAVDRDNATS